MFLQWGDSGLKWIDTWGLFQNRLHDEARGSDVNYRLIGDGIQR